MSTVRMVFVTVPDQDVGLTLVRTLLDEGLIACGNLVPGLRSIYRWRGAICDDSEVQLILKTTAAAWIALRDRIVALHPYDCPEVLCVAVEDGHPDYLRWVGEAVES